MKRVVKNRLIMFGAIASAIVIVVGALAPWLQPYSYDEVDMANRLAPPSRRFPLGTDQFGRDILSRIIYGTRISLSVGVLATGVAVAIGSVLGIIAGYYGKWTDDLIMRFMDLWVSFPTLILAVALVAFLGPNFRNVILAVGLVRVPQFARVARVCVLTVKNLEYVEAARSVGRTDASIILNHIVPNIIGPLMVLASLSMATAINAEASLSFIGLGVQPPVPSWGSMLADGRAYMLDAPWIATAPGLAVTLAVLGYNLLGDGLRDMLDPRLRGTVGK